MKEEKGAAIWFGRFDIGEGSLDMVILGVYTSFVREKHKQQNVREDGIKLRSRRNTRKKRRRINQIVKARIG